MHSWAISPYVADPGVDHAEDREVVWSVHGAERAAVRRKTPHSPGSHPMLWTVVDITLGGGGRGGGSPPPPVRKPCPGHDAKPGRFSWEMLAEMLHYCIASPYFRTFCRMPGWVPLVSRRSARRGVAGDYTKFRVFASSRAAVRQCGHREYQRLTRKHAGDHEEGREISKFKMTTSTSASCHLILEIFVACWDGHSGLTRECAKVGIIP